MPTVIPPAGAGAAREIVQSSVPGLFGSGLHVIDVEPLAARLHGHGEARQPGFEADLVGNDALERGDVRRAAGDAIAIHIEAHRQVERRLRA